MPELYLYADPSLQFVSHLYRFDLERLTERHKVRIEVHDLLRTTNLAEKLHRSGARGIVIGMCRGWPGLGCLRFARRVWRSGRKVWFYWPSEEAIECVDKERLRSYWRHWYVVSVYDYVVAPARQVLRRGPAPSPIPAPPSPSVEPTVTVAPRQTAEPATEVIENSTAAAVLQPHPTSQSIVGEYLQRVEGIIRRADPIPATVEGSEAGFRIAGKGIYLRTDFWAPITSGGSYGHTCYLVKELSNAADGVVAFLPHRYALLDSLGLHQVVLPSFAYRSESSLLEAPEHYRSVLRTAVEAVRPSFLYERICLGNYCGADLSQELGIPYIVEYNGSEIMMKRSFDSAPYEFEACYLAAETAAFKQATLISVVSEPIKEDLIKRGVPASKTIVNPNGADLDAYAPVDPEVKLSLRKAFGWNGPDRLVGFTGTFGGWHGIDVLAQAIPKICRRVPDARFLLIGDGQYKKLVDDEITKHRLGGRVYCTGRVPQQQGALFLRLCDIFVSPHSRHMVGSRFFGSPTKIFEYMAMGGAIVASDLEQIGEVLSPALRASQLNHTPAAVSDERAVLCTPGNVDEFVDAVEFLLRRPDICWNLGRNARQAVAQNYSWERHVQRLCAALCCAETMADVPRQPAIPKDVIAEKCTDPEPAASEPAPSSHEVIEVGAGQNDRRDAYKSEIQKQWDNDPCGSHYVKGAPLHTLEWFLEAEYYRYQDYAPWMLELMEFERHRDEHVLEIGGGMGTDLAQFARHGSIVTDVDLSVGHLKLAEENFRLRSLHGQFIHGDAERLPFDDNSFDLVYSNGVIHHTPNTAEVVREILRILRPGGRAIVMVYAENSWHYWKELVYVLGLSGGLLRQWSMGEIMSRHAELGEARPLVKVYTKERLKVLFRDFTEIQIAQRQLTQPELIPSLRRILSGESAGKMMGWNLIVKARKPLLQ